MPDEEQTEEEILQEIDELNAKDGEVQKKKETKEEVETDNMSFEVYSEHEDKILEEEFDA